MHELGSLLGRWHQWRRRWTPERRFARVALLEPAGRDLDDELEDATMRMVEQAVEDLPQQLQLAIQHVARAECMGVEVIHNPRLGEAVNRKRLVATALAELQRMLERDGVL